jgi:hypothetical protein
LSISSLGVPATFIDSSESNFRLAIPSIKNISDRRTAPFPIAGKIECVAVTTGEIETNYLMTAHTEANGKSF